LIVLFFVPFAKPSDERGKDMSFRQKLWHMDPIGTVLFIGTVCCLLLGLVWGGQTYPWNARRVIGVFVGFVILTACFSYWIWRQGELALIPIRVLRKRSIAMGSLTLFGIGLAINVVRRHILPSVLIPGQAHKPSSQYGYYLPLFFQAAQGEGVMMSGVCQIALIVPDILAIGITGIIVSKWGYYVC
jgi:hypothetical protein